MPNSRNFGLEAFLETIGEQNIQYLRDFQLQFGFYFFAEVHLTHRVAHDVSKMELASTTCLHTGVRHIMVAKPCVDPPTARWAEAKRQYVSSLGESLSRYLDRLLAGREGLYLTADDILMLAERMDDTGQALVTYGVLVS